MTTDALDVTADLTVEIEGAPVSIDGYGDRLVVDAPSLSVLRKLVGGLSTLPVSTSEAGAAAVGRGLAVDVRVAGASVARVGPDVRPGVLSRIAGVAPARISALGVARAIVRGRG